MKQGTEPIEMKYVYANLFARARARDIILFFHLFICCCYCTFFTVFPLICYLSNKRLGVRVYYSDFVMQLTICAHSVTIMMCRCLCIVFSLHIYILNALQ